ncbi:MAG: aldehyde ferredoxin oxidoreductase family protein [Chloroflexota bacterium]
MNYKGYIGKILTVDLSTGKTGSLPLSDAQAERFIGGRGLAVEMLYERLPAGTGPFDEANDLLILTGPAAGTPFPTGSRIAAATVSPLTGTLTTGYMGGHFAPELKFAGWDGILISGRAEKPVTLIVKDSAVRLVDASPLWGLDTQETQTALEKQLGHDVKTMCIGPAGENLVRYAAIAHEQHLVGRGGTGAIMGYKNLKAICVRGTGAVKVAAGPDLFLSRMREMQLTVQQDPIALRFRQIGTASGIPKKNKIGALPARNFQRGCFDYAEAYGGDPIKALIQRYESCAQCPISCGSAIQFEYNGETVVSERIEHESHWSLGPLCDIGDLKATLKANDTCDRLGMDTVSAGVSIAFAMEAYQNGLIGDGDLDGLDLNWGSAETLDPLLGRIARREGLGDLLAEGVRIAANRLGGGSDHYAMHVKGLEFPAFEPRAFTGMGLNFATASRGADHNRAFTIAAEYYGILGNLDRFEHDGKPEMVKDLQDFSAVIDSIVACMFTIDFSTDVELFAEAINLITGMSVDKAEYYRIGERINNMERLFNLRWGFTYKDDVLPGRIREEPAASAGEQAVALDVSAMLDRYYQLRGWDERGVPTPERLAALGLEAMGEAL